MATRIPTLEILLAYQVMLGVSIGEIYEGELARIDREVRARARGLRRYLEHRPATADLRRRIVYVQGLEDSAGLPAHPPKSHA
jgi:hypothetical protein